jgi:hypothetical protein
MWCYVCCTKQCFYEYDYGKCACIRKLEWSSNDD